MIVKKLKNLKFNIHMMISLGTVAFLAFAVTIVVISVRTSRLAEAEAVKKTQETAYRHGNFVNNNIEVSMATARTLSKTM